MQSFLWFVGFTSAFRASLRTFVLWVGFFSVYHANLVVILGLLIIDISRWPKVIFLGRDVSLWLAVLTFARVGAVVGAVVGVAWYLFLWLAWWFRLPWLSQDWEDIHDC
jgi:hypothetical protein